MLTSLFTVGIVTHPPKILLSIGLNAFLSIWVVGGQGSHSHTAGTWSNLGKPHAKGHVPVYHRAVLRLRHNYCIVLTWASTWGLCSTHTDIIVGYTTTKLNLTFFLFQPWAFLQLAITVPKINHKLIFTYLKLATILFGQWDYNWKDSWKDSFF